MTFKLINEFLTEARKKNKNYAEKFDKKIKDLLVEIEVEIKAGTKEGREWAEMASNYLALQNQQEDIAKTLGKLNDDLRTRVEDMFDATDSVATRIIKVGDLFVKVAKVSKSAPKTEIDYASILKDLSAISEEMAKKVEELTAQYSVVKPAAAERKPALRVSDEATGDAAKGKLKESVSSVLAAAARFFSKFTTWLTSIDKKIAKIESKIA